jgi:hypothetical protein
MASGETRGAAESWEKVSKGRNIEHRTPNIERRSEKAAASEGWGLFLRGGRGVRVEVGFNRERARKKGTKFEHPDEAWKFGW